MVPVRRLRVKICCIANVQEAWMAIQYGASAIGLVSKMPSGPGVIDEETIIQIASVVPPTVSSFLLTSEQDTKSIITQQRRCGVNTIQICDRLESGSFQDLRDAMPGIALVQVVHVAGEESVNEAVSVAPYVDAILLDSGNQSRPIKELGGTGRTHDWSISKRIRESVDVPIFLAGGLSPDNVADAIREVGPFGVDVCSGVRTNGALDGLKLQKFFSRVGGH
ncbi:MAG: phosphoribosylanthranilate isomerase [Ignavibacteria bacterium]|nr:phosphoribosylanthranilate isomerase [Ignavibacteria bacterium]MBI3766372.1 phosphoribosylanthranilate isomerase [Ignavibacteriales bacterium]